MARFGLPSIAFTVLGALLVGQLPQLTLKGLLGVFLLLFGVLICSARFPLFAPAASVFAVAGGLSGFLAGLIGTGGALRGAALNAFGIPKTRYIATAAAVALAVAATRIPIYVAQGFLSPDYYWHLPILLAAALIGSWLGKKVVDRVPQQRFKTVVSAAILLVGMKFVLDWLQGNL